MQELAADRMTMVAGTHEMAFAAHVANEAVCSDGGELLERDPPDGLFKRPRCAHLREVLGTWRSRAIWWFRPSESGVRGVHLMVAPSSLRHPTRRRHEHCTASAQQLAPGQLSGRSTGS